MQTVAVGLDLANFGSEADVVVAGCRQYIPPSPSFNFCGQSFTGTYHHRQRLRLSCVVCVCRARLTLAVAGLPSGSLIGFDGGAKQLKYWQPGVSWDGGGRVFINNVEQDLSDVWALSSEAVVGVDVRYAQCDDVLRPRVDSWFVACVRQTA